VYDKYGRLRDGMAHLGDRANTPGTSLQMITSDAFNTAAREVAVKSEPPLASRPRPSLYTPYQPVTTNTDESGRLRD
jgi:hypothetical protein